MKRAAFYFLSLAFLFLFLAVKSTNAQSVPTIISHQGRLLNASSQPVTSNVSVVFAIFNASSGGSQVWTETHSITPDNLGFYDVFLGGVNALPPSLPNPSYLEIKIGSETLSPRLQFGSVPFAQIAGGVKFPDLSTLTTAVGQQVGYAYQATNVYQGLTGTIPFDDTIPQSTEGTQFLSASLTPKSATNLLEIDVEVHFMEVANTGDHFSVAAFQDNSVNALAVSVMPVGIAGCNFDVSFNYLCTTTLKAVIPVGTTDATTIKIRAGISSGTVNINGSNTRKYGGSLYSTLIVREIQQ